MNDLMLDVETLGNKSYSALLSIGAVEFDINTGEIGSKFYKRIDLQSSLDVGLKVNGSTFYWWLQQSQAARDEICKENEHISIVIKEFYSYFRKINNPEIQIWGNGARLDIGLLEDAYEACGLLDLMPWKFRCERDVRTIVSIAPHVKDNYPFNGIEHHPVDDCIFQIGYTSEIWINHIKNNQHGK
ncbi:MAG: 3'-5' exonuclease [bacterium]